MTGPSWLNRTVWGIILATFLSDVSHEAATAVLPMFLTSAGYGALALGMIEGLADLLGSLSKLGGGVLGHHVEHKRPWTALGYVITAICTSLIGLARTLPVMIALRGVAWAGRGFRSPLRDYMLADAVEKSHYGRAYGLERAGDMLGAVVGPLLAALCVWLEVPFRWIIVLGVIPGLGAAAAMFFLTKERADHPQSPVAEETTSKIERPKFPSLYWPLLIGILLFGMGDFSRTFLVLLAARAVGGAGGEASVASAVLTTTVLLYAMHNTVSALAAYPAGHLGDRRAKLPVLIGGYMLGVVANVLLAVDNSSIGWLAMVFVISGFYIAVEETLEKAVVADLLPRELRSLGLGILACGNAVGDMASSLYVGFLLSAGQPKIAFGIAAGFGALGVGWMLVVLPRVERAVSDGQGSKR